jgi:GH15 family glucan-1,4-alpha-glucosidase
MADDFGIHAYVLAVVGAALLAACVIANMAALLAAAQFNRRDR